MTETVVESEKEEFNIVPSPIYCHMLELYQSEGCPHCQKVREALSELGLSYITHNPRLPGDVGGDVTNEVTHEELVAGGADQIPYLVDTENGVRLYESDDIVEYLEETYA